MIYLTNQLFPKLRWKLTNSRVLLAFKTETLRFFWGVEFPAAKYLLLTIMIFTFITFFSTSTTFYFYSRNLFFLTSNFSLRKFSSYKTKLLKMTSRFKLLIRNVFWSLSFWVTNLTSLNIKFHFELLTRR